MQKLVDKRDGPWVYVLCINSFFVLEMFLNTMMQDVMLDDVMFDRTIAHVVSVEVLGLRVFKLRLQRLNGWFAIRSYGSVTVVIAAGLLLGFQMALPLDVVYVFPCLPRLVFTLVYPVVVWIVNIVYSIPVITVI